MTKTEQKKERLEERERDRERERKEAQMSCNLSVRPFKRGNRNVAAGLPYIP
jgi:hypothetical protein